jgi:hypothetical protein
MKVDRRSRADDSVRVDLGRPSGGRAWLGYQASSVALAAVVTGALFAAASLAVAAILVRWLLGDRSGAMGAGLVIMGSAVGAGVGGWLVQPWLARLLAGIHRDAGV